MQERPQFELCDQTCWRSVYLNFSITVVVLIIISTQFASVFACFITVNASLI